MNDGSTPTPPPAAAPRPPRSNWRAVVAWCFEQTRRRLPQVGRFTRDVTRYYWGVREPLREFIRGLAPVLQSESVRLREVQLAPYEAHPLAEFGPDGWRVVLPDRCVVCGGVAAHPPAEELQAVDDAARAFWAPFGIMLLGWTIGWLVLGRWFAVLCIPLGFGVGYLLRTRVLVRLRLVRCDAHVRRTNLPQVLAWGDVLVIRFGHKSMRQFFREGQPVVRDPGGGVATADAPPVPPVTVPLADSPPPDQAVIRHHGGAPDSLPLDSPADGAPDSLI